MRPSVGFAPSLLTNPRVALPLNFAIGVLGALVAASRSGGLRVALALGAGALVWTFSEYAIHRWLMHQSHTPLLRKLWITLHRDHHRMREMDDPSHRSLSVAISGPVLLTLLLLAALATTSGAPLGFVSGFALGFWWYETLHFAEHHPVISRSVSLRWFARRQELHLSHHFEQMKKNFGFTTSLWDRVFGTYLDPSAQG